MTLQVDLWHEIKKMGQKNKVISQLGKKKKKQRVLHTKSHKLLP